MDTYRTMNISNLLRVAHAVRASGASIDTALYCAASAMVDGVPSDGLRERCRGAFERAESRNVIRAATARLAAPCEVTGFLLEIQNDDGEFVAQEFDPYDGDGHDTRLTYDAAWDDRTLEEFFILESLGFYIDPAIGRAWTQSSDSWHDRLGASFCAYRTPAEFPSPVGIWGGVIEEGYGSDTGKLWRVRRVTINGALKPEALRFFARHQ